MFSVRPIVKRKTLKTKTLLILIIMVMMAKSRQVSQHKHLNTTVFYPTIGRQYFVKTQTYVDLFGPRDLSQIFSNGMYIEVSPL